MEDVKDPEKVLKVTRGPWMTAQLDNVINFLQALAQVTASSPAARLAETMKIVRDGYADELHSCPSCSDVESRYPVLCTDCAPVVGATSPQKMLLRLDFDNRELWACAFFGIMFVPERLNQPNTQEAAEKMLDGFTDEASASAFKEMCDAGPSSEGEVGN